MATKKTRYVVVSIPKRLTRAMDIHQWSKCTSNKEIMMKYYEEIKTKHPTERVYLLTLEQAEKFRHAVIKHFRDIEAAKLKRLDEKITRLNAYYTFYDNF